MAVHYLTNHSFEWLETDRTAYYFVNEGMEAENKVVGNDFQNGKKGEECLVNLKLLLAQQQERMRKISQEAYLYPTEKENPPPLVPIIPGAEPTSWPEKFRPKKRKRQHE